MIDTFAGVFMFDGYLVYLASAESTVRILTSDPDSLIRVTNDCIIYSSSSINLKTAKLCLLRLFIRVCVGKYFSYTCVLNVEMHLLCNEFPFCPFLGP